jgi:hypothetical protein
MSHSQDPIKNIVQHIKDKSVVKQKTYKHLLNSFENLKQQATQIVAEINSQIIDVDKEVTVVLEEVSNHEFQVKVAGDMLVFVLHTNIVTFSGEHEIVKSDYISEDSNRKYFGQIMIYNFMADSIKYSRLNDSGYLVARLLINFENRFLVEGEGQLNFLYQKVSDQPISDIDLDVIIKLSITEAAQSDLVTPPFQKIKHVSLNQKMQKSSEMGAGEKIGFKMSYQSQASS